MAVFRALRAVVRSISRVITALLAAAITIGVLAGIPWALLHYAGDPIPHSVPTMDAVKHTLTSPMSPQMFLKALSVIGWYLWAILAISFLVELVAAARRVNSPHIPTLGPTQALAAAMITAIGITALMRAGPAHAAESFTASSPTGGRVISTAPAHPGTPRLSIAYQTVGHAAASATPRETVHTVRPGESLYTIAAEDLGDGEDWPALYKLNAGVVQPDGDKLANPDLIRPDWKIRIAASPVDPAPATNSSHAHTPAPAKHVPDAPAPAVPVPKTPLTPPSSSPSMPATRPTPHTPANSEPGNDQRRDTARRHGGAAVGLPDGGAIGITLAVALGSALVLSRRWRNRLSDPRFPTPEPPLPGTLQAARRAHLRVSSASLQSIEDRAGGATGQQDLNGDDDAALDFDTPGTDDTIAGTRQPLAEDNEALDLYFDDGEDSDRCNPDDDSADEDDDLGGAEPDYGLGTRYSTPLVPGTISAAERGGAEVPLIPTGLGLGLIGPGAAGAARAIAAGVLSAGAPDRTADLARLIIPAADLAALLGVEETALPQLTAGLPELIVTRGLAEALAEAEVHALFRTRLLEEYEVDDLDTLGVEHPDEEDCPPLVVMASPTRPLAVRLNALIASAAPLRITAVLLGGWPSATAFVEHDGTATGPAAADWAGTRLWNLSPTGLGDVITLLARAAGHQPEITEAAVVTDPWPQLEPVSAPYQADTAASDNNRNATVTALPVRTANVTQPAIGQPTTEDTPEATQEPTEAESAIAPVTVLPIRPVAPAAEVADAGAAGIARAAALLTAWQQHPVQIRVLGGLRISVAGQPVAGLRTQARVLAALLAIKGPAGVTAAQIDAMCWPDASPDDADRVVKWRKDGITSLRTRLNATAGRRGSAYIALDRATGRYSLAPDLVATDVAALTALTTAARTAHSSEDRLALLAAASPLCAGALLDGELGDVFDWADDYAPTFADQQTTVLGRLADLAADAERTDQALGALEQAAALTEDAEPLYRRMFDILAAAGRHTEIPGKLRILETFTDSLGADVSAETRQAAADAMRTRQPKPTAVESKNP